MATNNAQTPYDYRVLQVKHQNGSWMLISEPGGLPVVVSKPARPMQEVQDHIATWITGVFEFLSKRLVVGGQYDGWLLYDVGKTFNNGNNFCFTICKEQASRNKGDNLAPKAEVDTEAFEILKSFSV